jgi:hypothetical protein
MMSDSTNERKRILKDLNKLVGSNLNRDNVSMLNKLSEDFYNEVELAKKCAGHKDAAGAEVHRIIAEYLHEVSLTFEAIKK